MVERPGIMFFFDDWLPLMELEDASIARLIRAALRYGRYGELPELDGTEAILWAILLPKLNRDAERYQNRRDSGEYAVYCREAKRTDVAPLSFDDWKIEKNRSLSNDNDSNQQHLHQQQHPHQQSHMQPHPHAPTACESAADSSRDRDLSPEQEFEEKRRKAIESLNSTTIHHDS